MTTETKTNDVNHNFAELLEKYDSLRPHRGQIVQGKVLALTEEAVILDIGAKRDAIVPRRELARLDETTIEDLTIGDRLPVYVTSTSGRDDELQVSIEKGLELRDWERAEACLESGEILELKVTGYNKGGLLVEFGRLNGFVPNSLIPNLPRSLSKDELQSAKSRMIGASLALKVLEVDQSRKRLVLSARAVEIDRRKQRLRELQAGEKVTGTVSNIVDFGVFVDLEGVDGLIHSSRLSWEDVEHPSDVIQAGEEVEVLVKEVDTERERVSLDRRALLPGPWDQFARQHHRGDILEGTVEAVRDFGAFVKLTDEITGLIHSSELLQGSTKTPTKALQPGDKVLIRIMDIDPERERVGLSMRRVPLDDVARWMLENEDYSIKGNEDGEEEKIDENESRLEG